MAKKIPEFSTQSRRPGIGAGWYGRYKKDVHPSDSVVVRGKEMRPPKYYDKLYEKESRSNYAKLKIQREENKLKQVNKGETSSDRLKVKEIIQEQKLQQLKRRI